MKKILIFLSAISFSSSSLYPLTENQAIAGTSLTAFLAIANTSRLHGSPHKYGNAGKTTWTPRILGAKSAAVLGLFATIFVGGNLVWYTPDARRTRAKNHLKEANNLLFKSTLKNLGLHYPSSPYPLAQAFEDLQKSRTEADKAVTLIHAAQKDTTIPLFGQTVLEESEKTIKEIDGLMIAVKNNPDFIAQYAAYVQTEAAAKNTQTIRSIATSTSMQAGDIFANLFKK